MTPAPLLFMALVNLSLAIGFSALFGFRVMQRDWPLALISIGMAYRSGYWAVGNLYWEWINAAILSYRWTVGLAGCVVLVGLIMALVRSVRDGR